MAFTSVCHHNDRTCIIFSDSTTSSSASTGPITAKSRWFSVSSFLFNLSRPTPPGLFGYCRVLGLIGDDELDVIQVRLLANEVIFSHAPKGTARHTRQHSFFDRLIAMVIAARSKSFVT